MEYDKLVKLIVDEVLKRIDEKAVGESHGDKKTVVIFDKDDMHKYSNFLEAQYEAILFNENIRDCNAVLISRLCLRGMGNLANLICSTEEENFIIKMLMKGRKIYIAEEGLLYKKYKNSAPKQVYNKYLEFEDTLKKYGFEVISNAINMSRVNNTDDEKFISISKKLITEADIKKNYIAESKVVFIEDKSIITPLAKDYIQTNHIEIKRIER